jgi:hypothetical protein
MSRNDDTYEKHAVTFQQGKNEIKVVIRKVWDYDGVGMEDDLGKFTDKWEEGAFDRLAHNWEQNSDGSWREPRNYSREYRYFVPEQSPENIEDALPHYRKHFAKHQAWLRANAMPRYQYERAEALNKQHWGYIGIAVEMYVNGEEEASSSCWGFESDAEPSGWRKENPWTTFEREHNLYDPLYHPGKYKNKAAYAYAMGKRSYLTENMEDIAHECLHEAQRAADNDHGKNELALRRWFKKELKTKTMAQLADWIVANAEEECIR